MGRALRAQGQVRSGEVTQDQGVAGQDLDQGVGGRGVAGLGGQDRGIAGQDRVQAAADQGRGILLLQWLGALQVCQKRRRNSSAMVN